MVCTRWAWGIWGGAASQGARANASAFGGISYSRRHGDGPAAARHLARERRRRPCGSGHCAMASPARSIQPSGTALSTPAQSRRPTKKTESAYPRPRDRRLSRKTRAAVGKPPGSTTAELAVSSADSPGANALPIGHQENTSTPLLLQTTRSWRSIGTFPRHWRRKSCVAATVSMAGELQQGKPAVCCRPCKPFAATPAFCSR